jgi:geranylgeranyl diphosphate synthase type II
MIKNASEIQQLIASLVPKLSYGTNPANLYDPITYIMSLGGKRLRPALTLMGYQLSGNNPEEILKVAMAVEVFHNFTLMHDDIMDQAPVRRGKPTVHEKWNQTVAILSGDTMLVKAYDFLLEVKPELLPNVIRKFNQTAVKVCEGQQIDMNFESESVVSEPDYIEMIRLKTAVLLGFSLEYGGILAEMDAAQTRLLYQMGESMGIGFQLMDDYLDVYGDKEKFGKQVGGDIIANKKTYLLINALAKAEGKTKKQIDYWLSQKSFNPEEKVAAITTIYNELSIPQLTQIKMNAYFDQSFELLNSIKGDAEAKKVLINFAQNLMKRES